MNLSKLIKRIIDSDIMLNGGRKLVPNGQLIDCYIDRCLGIETRRQPRQANKSVGSKLLNFFLLWTLTVYNASTSNFAQKRNGQNDYYKSHFEFYQQTIIV